jgi:RNA polymerase sigma-70 factor (ECF subfamily)
MPDIGNKESLPADSDMVVRDMLRVIDNLSDKLKVPFKLSYEGYHYREISEKLGLPEGTVKSRIFKARERIMRKLKQKKV